MPEKYHIETSLVPPRLPRIGKYGIVDWREDCARCHNCVKKACIYDKYREESRFIMDLNDVHTIFNECMGCFSCVQNCTKGLLCLSINPDYKYLGNEYWKPEIIRTTWLQAETGKVPVSGAGYRGKFSGHGFDSMWTDMSEIVRPTRDGIHGREYISTSVDIGRKPSYLSFEGDMMTSELDSILSIPFPVIFDLTSSEHTLPNLEPSLIETAKNSISTFDKILKLQKGIEQNLSQLGNRAKNGQKVINYLYQMPLIRANKIKEITKLSMPSVYQLIKELEKLQIIKEITGWKRGKIYMFNGYLDLFKGK